MSAELSRLCTDAASVPIVDHETAAPEVVSGLTTRALDLLSSSLHALDAVAEGRGLPAEAADSTAADPPSGAPLEIDAVAHAVALARFGLRARQRALLELGAAATLPERLAAADGVFRTIQRALGAVELAVATAHHAEPAFRFYERSLATSLEVRRRYVELHRRATRGAPPTAEHIAGHLRRIGNAISELFGKPVAPALRTRDRALLVRARDDIRRWLARDRSEAFDAAAGLHLFHDLASLTTLLLDVSKREELVRHDALLVRAVLADPALDAAPAAPPTEADRVRIASRLRPMIGRSRALDALLDRRAEELPLAEVRRVLEQIGWTLGDTWSPLADAL